MSTGALTRKRKRNRKEQDRKDMIFIKCKQAGYYFAFDMGAGGIEDDMRGDGESVGKGRTSKIADVADPTAGRDLQGEGKESIGMNDGNFYVMEDLSVKELYPSALF